MPSIKEYTTKIKSLNNTKKVTKTMQLISTSKLKKIQNDQKSTDSYTNELQNLAKNLFTQQTNNPLIKGYSNSKKVLLVIFSSDKGLCGGFNHNLFKLTYKKLEEFKKDYANVDLITCGNKAFSIFEKTKLIIKNFSSLASHANFNSAKQISSEVESLFLKNNYHRVFFIYNHFESILKQNPTINQFLPLSMDEFTNNDKSTDYILEPNKSYLVNLILQKLTKAYTYNILLHNSIGEHAARMTSMDNASSNAQNLISDYTLLKNRARQEKITTELTEIVSGAESLK